MKSVAFACLILLAGSITANWADHPPYCYFPEKYPVTMKPVDKQVNVGLYMGQWYAVFHFPDSFEKDCICSNALYAINSGGWVDVTNTCQNTKGQIETVIGTAVSVNADNTELEVSFPQAPIKGNYWFLDFDDQNYQWAIIGEPCRKDGWFLSRTKSVPRNLISYALSVYSAQGYENTDKVNYRNPNC